MLGRRFLLLVAVLMGLTALAASLAPREPLVREDERRTPTPSPSATQSPATTALGVVERTISTAAPADRVTVRAGQILELTVEGSELDSVRVLDKIEPIETDSPALFNVLAEAPGTHPIELVDAERRIGTLVIR